MLLHRRIGTAIWKSAGLNIQGSITSLVCRRYQRKIPGDAIVEACACACLTVPAGRGFVDPVFEVILPCSIMLQGSTRYRAGSITYRQLEDTYPIRQDRQPGF